MSAYADRRTASATYPLSTPVDSCFAEDPEFIPGATHPKEAAASKKVAEKFKKFVLSLRLVLIWAGVIFLWNALSDPWSDPNQYASATAKGDFVSMTLSILRRCGSPVSVRPSNSRIPANAITRLDPWNDLAVMDRLFDNFLSSSAA